MSGDVERGRAPLVGMGCMRLSTERDRNAAEAVAVLHAAFDAGVTFFDTADAYCWDASEAGHNERLIAHALATWAGDRSRIVVATKGGITRPQGNWVEDGRAVTSPLHARPADWPSASSASNSISCTRPIRERRSRRVCARLPP